MNHHYAEILAAFPIPPLWWSENAFPRWVEFTPKELDNIYASECVLLEIACQGCGHKFVVAMSRSAAAYRLTEDGLDWSEEPPHYGDPPNIGCCDAGPTMNVDLVRVIEHWRQNKGLDWVRVEAVEKVGAP